MRHNPDNPVDPLGGLGAPVRQPAAAPAAPAPAPHFELGNWAATLPEGLAEKPAEPITDAEASGWDLGHFGPGCTACGGALMTFCSVSMCGNLDCRG